MADRAIQNQTDASRTVVPRIVAQLDGAFGSVGPVEDGLQLVGAISTPSSNSLTRLLRSEAVPKIVMFSSAVDSVR